MDNYFLSNEDVYIDALNDCVKNNDFSGYFDLLNEHFIFGLWIDGILDAD